MEEYSRPATIEDLKTLLRSLNQHPTSRRLFPHRRLCAGSHACVTKYNRTQIIQVILPHLAITADHAVVPRDKITLRGNEARRAWRAEWVPGRVSGKIESPFRRHA